MVLSSDSEEREAYISQMFELETEFNGRKYYLDLAENISFLSKKEIFLETLPMKRMRAKENMILNFWQTLMNMESNK